MVSPASRFQVSRCNKFFKTFPPMTCFSDPLKMDISMKQLILMSVDDFVQKKLKKLRWSKAGKNLKKFETLDDLFDELEI